MSSSTTEAVEAVERAYVAAATGGILPSGGTPAARQLAFAALGAIASRYLAVGTPRTLGLVADAYTLDDAVASHLAHRTWFKAPRIRCTAMSSSQTSVLPDPAELASYLAKKTGGEPVPLSAALACDIVCVHIPLTIAASQLRRGTHVNLLSGGSIDDELRQLATVADEVQLGALAAGLVDGRQLDELTVFIAGDGAVAIATLSALYA